LIRVLLYAVTGALTPAEGKLSRGHSWSISAIVLWEIAKLAQLGRILVDLDDRQVGKTLTRVPSGPSPPRSPRRAPASTYAATPQAD
jgi:hypothetical protein